MSNKNPYEELVEHARLAWNAEKENAERIQIRKRVLVTALTVLFGLGLFKVEWLRGESQVSRINHYEWNYIIRGFLSFALLAFAMAFFRLRSDQFLKHIAFKSLAGRVATIFSILIICSGLVMVWVESNAITASPAIVISGLLLIFFGTLNLLSFRSSSEAGSKIISPKAPSIKHPTSSHYLHLSPDLIDAPDSTTGEILQVIYYSTRTAAADLRDRNTTASARLRRTQIWFGLGLSLAAIAVLCYLWTSVPPLTYLEGTP